MQYGRLLGAGHHTQPKAEVVQALSDDGWTNGNPNEIKKRALERWPRGKEHMQLFQRTRVWLPAPTSDGSQLLGTSALGEAAFSFGC